MGSSLGYEILLAWLITANMTLSFGRVAQGSDTRVWARAWAPALAGVSIGLAVLAQSKALVIVPVIIYLLWRQRRSRALWGLIGFTLSLLPWVIRNLFVTGSPSPFTRNGPYNLWVGNNPYATTGGSMLVAPELPAGATSQTQAAIHWIVQQPEIALQLTFRKAMRLFEPNFLYPEFISPGPLRTLLHVYVAGFAAIILLGLLVFIGARFFASPPTIPDVTPLAVSVILFYAAHLPFIAEPRFMTVVQTFTIVIAVATFGAAARRWRRHTESQSG